MSINAYRLEAAPSPKDAARFKLSLSGSESEIRKIVDKLSNISSRPFPASENNFDWSLYLYDLKDNLKIRLEKELSRLVGSESEPPDMENQPSFEAPPPVFLNSRYTFENFVIGANTRFTYAACKAVAEKPGKNYNPLFIYGGVGLGKTHLMQAIGNYVREKFPEMKIVSITTQDFINSVVEAIETNTIKEVSDTYKKIDLLLIDDIQFLEQSDATQEEFFHIFNAMHEIGKQIVMTSDKPPKKLSTLEERLKSRFEWGLTTDIKSPNLDTRKAILKRKSEQAGIELDEKVTNYIAERLTSNIRELEGIINRIKAFQELTEEPANLEHVREIIKNILSYGEDEDSEEGVVEEIEETTPALAPPPPPPVHSGYPPIMPPPNYCIACAGPLTFVPQYQRWYCHGCATYSEPSPHRPAYAPPPQYPPLPQPPPQYPPLPPPPSENLVRCQTCSSEARYIPEYKRYYCDSCGGYLPEKTKIPPPPPEPERKPLSKKIKKKIASLGAPEQEKPEEVSEKIDFENKLIGEEKEGLREIRVGYFIPEKADNVLNEIIGQLSRLASQKKFSFYIRPIFVHRYRPDATLNLAKFAQLARDNSVDLSLIMEPVSGTDSLSKKISKAMDFSGIPYEVIPNTSIRESDALNLMLDIAICAKKRN